MFLRYAPIDAWPGALRDEDDRRPSDFKASWSDTIELLDREAWHLGCEEVVIRLAIPGSAVNANGQLRDGRKPPSHPGVIVVLDAAVGTLTYHTDLFRRRGYRDELASWQHNVRAVALALEALRKVERYGIADAGEQYAGWKQLGTGVAMGARPDPLTLAEAAHLLAAALEVPDERVLVDHDIARASYRRAVRLLHPDVGGSGDSAQMTRLDEAWRLVDTHHKESA